MVEYRLVEEVSHTNNECNKSYGIAVYIDKTKTETVEGISQNKNDVENLISKFNRYELSPCHISQAVEDFLYDQRVD